MSSWVAMPKIADLTVELLETDPQRYAWILETVSTWEETDEVKERLNEKPYETWYSNHPFALSRLVGELNSEAREDASLWGTTGGSFYGSKNVEGISTGLAIKLLKMMLNAGGDINSKDYYGKSVLEMLKNGSEESRFYRTGNEEYTRFVETLFHKEEPEEGIPPEK